MGNVRVEIVLNRPRPAVSKRLSLTMTALGAAVATGAGWSGVGDAPHPQRPALEISQHFVSSRERVLHAAGFGYIGALAFLGFVLLFARRLHRSNALWPARFLIAGGVATTSYLVLLQVLWTTLSYDVAASSPAASKALFNVTFLAVPVLSIGLSTTFLAAAVGASRARMLPRWWSLSSGVVGVVAAFGIVSFEDSGFGSPDVQQQVGGNVLLVWLLLTASVIAMRRVELRAPRRVPPPSEPSVVRPLSSSDQRDNSDVKDKQSTVAFLVNRAAA